MHGPFTSPLIFHLGGVSLSLVSLFCILIKFRPAYTRGFFSSSHIVIRVPFTFDRKGFFKDVFSSVFYSSTVFNKQTKVAPRLSKRLIVLATESLTVFAKHSILDVLRESQFTSELVSAQNCSVFGNPFQTNVPNMEKPGSWFLLAKCVKNTCGRVTF